jgi:branched-chain amino acid aminotransferase
MLKHSKHLYSQISKKFCQTPTFKNFNDLNLEILAQPKPPENNIDNITMAFGEMFSPHMLEINYSDENGWEDAKIKPLENFSIHPANSTLHYALTCYEGTLK